jgi:hypothetical protein
MLREFRTAVNPLDTLADAPSHLGEPLRHSLPPLPVYGMNYV